MVGDGGIGQPHDRPGTVVAAHSAETSSPSGTSGTAAATGQPKSGTQAGCPTAGELVAVFQRSNPRYGAQAHPINAVVCAGGFATIRVKSPNTPDGLSTIYAIGPPVRFLGAGTGPICADKSGQGPSVIVPHSAAAKLNCMVTPSDTATSPGAAPTLGLPFPPMKGYGQVKPHEVNNDGDGASYVSDITWSSWGSSHAVGTGTAYYVSPQATSMIDGTMERATVVAYDLGSCGGHPAYQRVTWYFPQHGESLTSNQGFDACTGP